MRGSFERVRAGAVSLLLVAVLVAPAAFADNQPFTPLEARVSPPTGVSSQARVSPPTETPEEDGGFLQLFVLWLEMRFGAPVLRELPAGSPGLSTRSTSRARR
jgi:hypothetical protein